MDGYPTFSETAHRLIEHRPPETPEVAEALDRTRGAFHDLTHAIAPLVPESADAQIAARRIHDACQAVISAIVHHQDAPILVNHDAPKEDSTT